MKMLNPEGKADRLFMYSYKLDGRDAIALSNAAAVNSLLSIYLRLLGKSWASITARNQNTI